MFKHHIDAGYAMEIRIKGDFIARPDVVSIVEKIENALEREITLVILKAEKILKEIDILLLGYLALYREQHPALRFELWLLAQNSDGPVYHKLQQSRLHAELSLRGELFKLKEWDGSREVRNLPLNPFNNSNWRLAETFAPLLIVTRQTFRQLFIESVPTGRFSMPLPQAAHRESFEGGLNEEAPILDAGRGRLLAEYKSKWLNLVKKSQEHYRLPHFARISFWSALESAKIFESFVDGKRSRISDIQCGHLRGAKALHHYRTVRPVFEQLEAKPPIYHFVFYLLLSSSLLPARLNAKTAPMFQERVSNLWEFANRLVAGLIELALNIVEHSTEGKGGMTLRLYDREQFSDVIELKRELGDELMEIKKANVLFDINVFDLGAKGVTETLLESVSSWAATELNANLRRSLESDRDRLANAETTLRDLLDRNTGTELQHQAKRAVAHLGLQVFSSIITDNAGFIRASTWLIESDRRDKASIPVVKNIEGANFWIDRGTNFNILLPVDGDREYGTRFPGHLTTFNETTQLGIQQIESLFNVVVDTHGGPGRAHPHLAIPNRDVMSVFLLPTRSLENRNDEHTWWADVRSALPHSFHASAFRVLDFENVTLSASQLFRFLGRFHLTYPHDHLIVIHISNDLFLELKSINDEFVQRARLRNATFPYWNANSVTLIYSYVSRIIDGSEQRFHLVDALWGNTKEDFASINKVIRKTNFNSVTLLDDEIISSQGGLPAVSSIDVPLRHFNLFQEGRHLLPFDLLLTDGAGTTLFEDNAQFLLVNELRII